MPGPAAGWRSTTAPWPGSRRPSGPYLPGILQLDAEIAGNRVSGLFPLDDMHTSLDMLGRSLPIRVLRYSDYWISLRPA
ncbi:transmembrane sensor protein [Pseudomonas aeruginosa]|nr:transmembrane sensor protein [Pseudomonas aeruginosa]